MPNSCFEIFCIRLLPRLRGSEAASASCLYHCIPAVSIISQNFALLSWRYTFLASAIFPDVVVQHLQFYSRFEALTQFVDKTRPLAVWLFVVDRHHIIQKISSPFSSWPVYFFGNSPRSIAKISLYLGVAVQRASLHFTMHRYRVDSAQCCCYSLRSMQQESRIFSSNRGSSTVEW